MTTMPPSPESPDVAQRRARKTARDGRPTVRGSGGSCTYSRTSPSIAETASFARPVLPAGALGLLQALAP